MTDCCRNAAGDRIGQLLAGLPQVVPGRGVPALLVVDLVLEVLVVLQPLDPAARLHAEGDEGCRSGQAGQRRQRDSDQAYCPPDVHPAHMYHSSPR